MAKLRRREPAFIDKKHEKRVKNFVSQEFEHKNSVPNIITKSNYFLPVRNTDKYFVTNTPEKPIFKKLCVINNSINLLYSGYRGNLFDFGVYYKLLNKAKNNSYLELEISQSEMMSCLKLSKNSGSIRAIIHNSLMKMKYTSLEININEDIFYNFSLIDRYNQTLEGQKKIVFLKFAKSLTNCLAVDNFNYLDERIMEKLDGQLYAIRLYTLLNFNKNQLFITKKNLIEMYQPNPNNLRQFFAYFTKKAVEPLKDIGIITKWDKGDTNYTFNIDKQPEYLSQVAGDLKETLSKREKLKKGLDQNNSNTKAKNTSKVKENTKIKHRKEIMEIVDYWESLGLYKHKNRNTKVFNEGLKYLSLAIDGKLYDGTVYEEFNQEFKPEIIKRTIKDFAAKVFDDNVYPINKESIRKTNLAFFMLPNIAVRQKFDKPFFIDCFKNGVTFKETLGKDLENHFVSFKRAYVRYNKSKMSEITKSEEAMLIKSFKNLLKGGFDHEYSFMGDPADRYLAVFKGIEHKWDKKVTLKDFMIKNPDYIIGWYKNYKRENNIVF